MASEDSNPNDTPDDEPQIVVVDAELVVAPQTKVREAIQPYLPPPVVNAIHKVDPLLEPYVGAEATINIFGTLLLGLLLYQILQQAINFSGSKAVVADEDTQALTKQLTQKAFEESILIWGPSGAGKTRLFYYLCFGTASIKSIASLRTNVGFRKFASSKTIRFLDLPGHEVLDDAARSGQRILLLIDATQPVATAADLLYQILMSRTKSKPLSILLCCNKSDVAGSKNWKRIKIQLRTEMERLLKVQQSGDDTATASMEEFQSSSGKWVWDDNEPNNMSFAFLSTSLQTKAGLEAVEGFCENGTVPDQSIRKS